MNAEDLKPIIEQAIKGEFNIIWLVVGAVSLFLSGFGLFLGSYMKRKGHNLATKEDFQSIKTQLAEQTTTTEEIKAVFAAMNARTLEEIKTEFLALQASTVEGIKAEISNSYLTRQEWSKTKKAKLEELVNYAYELHQLISNDANKLRDEFYSDSGVIFNTMPIQILKIEMLSMLYFYDELILESMELVKSFIDVQGKIIEQFHLHKKVISGEISDPNVLQKINMSSEVGRLHHIFNTNFIVFQKKARWTLGVISQT